MNLLNLDGGTVLGRIPEIGDWRVARTHSFTPCIIPLQLFYGFKNMQRWGRLRQTVARDAVQERRLKNLPTGMPFVDYIKRLLYRFWTVLFGISTDPARQGVI